jgi:hypothetical protein
VTTSRRSTPPHVLRVGPAPAHALATAEVIRSLRAALAPLRAGPAPVVVVNDPQRATATDAVLLALARDALLVVATGSHARPPAAAATRFETPLRAALTPHACDVHWHDARAPGAHVALGPSCVLDARVVAAPRLLAIGSVEPHYFAGVTGAHKTATIGVADQATITHNHAHATSLAAAPLALDGNPVYEGVAAMVDALEARPAAVAPTLAVNLVQRGDLIIDVVVTPLREAARAGLAAIAGRMAHQLARPASVVVAHVHGPLGVSLYQADKGIKNVEAAVADGGAIVLDAPCDEGLGQAAFADLLREAPDLAAAQALVARRGYRLGAAAARALRPRRARVRGDARARRRRRAHGRPASGRERRGGPGARRRPRAPRRDRRRGRRRQLRLDLRARRPNGGLTPQTEG